MLVPPEHVAKGGDGVRALGLLARHASQRRDRFVQPVEIRKIARGAEPCRPGEVRSVRDGTVGVDCGLQPRRIFEDFADQEAGRVQIVPEEERKARVNQRGFAVVPLRYRGGHTEQSLRQPLARIGDEGRHRLAGIDRRQRALDPDDVRILLAVLFVDRAGLRDAPVPHQEAAERGHGAMRAVGGRDGFPQEGLGIRDAPGEIVYQAGVEAKEGPVGHHGPRAAPAPPAPPRPSRLQCATTPRRAAAGARKTLSRSIASMR